MGSSKQWPVATVLVLTVAALIYQGWAWMSFAERDSAEERALATIYQIGQYVDDAVMGVNDFVAMQNDGDRVKSREGMAAANAALTTLESTMPDRKDDIEAIKNHIAGLDKAAVPIYAGRTLDERQQAMYSFDELVPEVKRAVWDLFPKVARNQETQDVGTLAGMSLVNVFALLAVLVIFIIHARRSSGAMGRIEDEFERAAQQITGLLDDAARGEQPGNVDAPGRLNALFESAKRVSDTLRDTKSVLRRERTHTRFNHNLMNSLEIAASEEGTFRIVETAGKSALGGRPLQFLLSDNSRTVMRPRIADVECACDPPSPFDCPALRGNRTLVHNPESGLARCPRLTRSGTTVACVAMIVRGESAGVLQLSTDSILEEDTEILTTMSLAVGARLGTIRTLRERELQAASDGLTGLANRRAMNEYLSRLDERKESYSVIFADLDHFKRLNDTYGHDVGDRCLRVFSQVLRESARSSDLACRPGGEEFVLILHEADPQQALDVAERVRKRTRETSTVAGVMFTVSLGIAGKVGETDSSEIVVRYADQALYAAKSQGRDRAVAWSPEIAVKSGADVQTAITWSGEDGEA